MNDYISYMDIFEIVEEMQGILDLIINDEASESDLENFQELELDFNEKIAQSVAKLKNLQSSRESVIAQRKILQNRERVLGTAIERLDTFIYSLLYNSDTKKAGNALHTAQRVRKRTIINVLNEDSVPNQFVEEVTQRKINKNDLYNWYKNTGEIVDGIEVVEGEEYLKTT